MNSYSTVVESSIVEYPIVEHDGFTYVIINNNKKYYYAQALFEYPKRSGKYYFIPSSFSSVGDISMKSKMKMVTHIRLKDIKTLSREFCLEVCPGYLDDVEDPGF